MPNKVRMTNAEFATYNKELGDACWKVEQITGKEFPATARQAGKWRRKTGLAWKTVHGKEV